MSCSTHSERMIEWRPSPAHNDRTVSGEEIVEIAKLAVELEAAIEAAGEATGLGDLVRQITGTTTDRLRLRRERRLLVVLKKTAGKIKDQDLPVQGIQDKLLLAVLEGASDEDDESMQERWANLLTKSLTAEEGGTRVAFAKILAELEPFEATLLDSLWETRNALPEHHRASAVPLRVLGSPDETPIFAELDNLVRLGLLRLVRSFQTTMGGASEAGATLDGVQLTELGLQFVQACQGVTAN
jgi:Abortive infection alpha